MSVDLRTLNFRGLSSIKKSDILDERGEIKQEINDYFIKTGLGVVWYHQLRKMNDKSFISLFFDWGQIYTPERTYEIIED